MGQRGKDPVPDLGHEGHRVPDGHELDSVDAERAVLRHQGQELVDVVERIAQRQDGPVDRRRIAPLGVAVPGQDVELVGDLMRETVANRLQASA